MPQSVQLCLNNETDLFIYLTGHGGEEFLKIKDQEELTKQMLVEALENLKRKNMFRKQLFVIDTVIFIF